MPIRLPTSLPAYQVLEREGVMVMSEETGARQDIRPLRIALLNLMPKKIATEIQFARLIGATPLQIDLHLLRMGSHRSRNTSQDHIDAFYQVFDEVADEKFDGLLITGAPVETLGFEEVGYWPELTRVLDWTQTHVHSTFGICWGAMAMGWHLGGLPKHALTAKAFGCFRHQNMAPASPYLRGFSDDMVIPVSRWTEVRQEDVEAAGMVTLLSSPEVGPCLVEDPAHRALYIFNHLEYDSGTLGDEYQRDLASGAETAVPVNYYPNDDPSQAPQNRWRSHAHLLYGNWINQIYQTTPYDLSAIGT